MHLEILFSSGRLMHIVPHLRVLSSINNHRLIPRSLRLTRQRDNETRRVSTTTNDASAPLKVFSSLRCIPRGRRRQSLTRECHVPHCCFFLSSSPTPSLCLSLSLPLLETHLLTAARLIPPLSTGKRVPSLLLFLLPRAFIHFR